ncbi:hypothetical protein L9F63_024937 [Diploptera punctata]|uniref:Uncharacterized protein n=1 Tax=Diploptera punctata TaxID=6984 RepID=A0AAD7ZEA6_DIPPU|nr:hypothetical protein L9F63_024937 [Diploptera punctata]
MYTYSHNAEPTHAKFVDYQMSTWTSPAVDLSYFIIANASVEIVLKPEIMLEEYFKTLCETLATLGHDHLCPPKEYLYDQYDKRCKFGIIVGLVVRCFTFKQNSKVDSSGADSNKKNLSYFTDSYKKDMKKMLPYFVQRGWL